MVIVWKWSSLSNLSINAIYPTTSLTVGRFKSWRPEKIKYGHQTKTPASIWTHLLKGTHLNRNVIIIQHLKRQQISGILGLKGGIINTTSFENTVYRSGSANVLLVLRVVTLHVSITSVWNLTKPNDPFQNGLLSVTEFTSSVM